MLGLTLACAGEFPLSPDSREGAGNRRDALDRRSNAPLLDPPAGPLQIVVDPADPAYLRRADGSRFFMAGPGDPEGFLYRGSRNADGTRNGDQLALIGKLAGTGANCIYFQAVRSHGGDGPPDHNPFIDSDPALGELDADILDQWEIWISAMDVAGIAAFFILYDDDACIWDCDPLNDHFVPAEESTFVTRIIDRFEHHENLIWVIAEEYQEEFSAQRVSALASLIRTVDDHDHVISVHKLSGLSFAELENDPNIDQFAIQYNVTTAAAIHAGVVQAFGDAAGRYNLNLAESAAWGTGVVARQKSWAAAMGGASVMVLGWDIASTDSLDMVDAGRLVRFMERVPLSGMEPRDDLSFAGTAYVLADLPGASYVLYSSTSAVSLGVKMLATGIYDLQWLDPASGLEQNDWGTTVTGGDTSWPRPSGFGAETALLITPTITTGI